jgi:flagellar basal-body rod protein FlgG
MFMVQVRSLTLLVAFSLLCGCSEQRTPSRPRSHVRRSPVAAPANSLHKELARSKSPKSDVVQAAHMQGVKDAASLPTEAPLPLDDASADCLVGSDHGQNEASLILVEATKALRTKLAVIGHNLANVETIGFKRSRATLESGSYRRTKLPGAQDAFNNYAPIGIEVGQGCRIQSVEVDFQQGPIRITNRPLDVAIDGDGFFQVINPTTNGFVYTRAGNFAITSNGLLVTGSSNTGRLVQPQISIPIDTTGIVISGEGNVSIQQSGQTQYSQIGQFQLAKFLNPQGLLKLGENLYQETLSSGAAIFGQPGTNGLGTLQQNALECSNVVFDDEVLAWKATQRLLRTIERLDEGL